MQKFLRIIFLVVVLCIPSIYARAVEQDAGKGSLSDLIERQPLFRKQAYIFLDVAFQNHLWGDVVEQGKVKNTISSSLPDFLREPILRTEGMPKFGVINKWNRHPLSNSIKVDLALIQILNSSRSSDDAQSELLSHQQALEDHIQSGISALNAQGSVKLEYNQVVKNLKDIQGDRIVIIPFSRNDRAPDPKLKAVNATIGGGVYHYSHGMIAAEMSLKGIVRFTTDDMEQVDGYFIPDKNNQIVSSICYLNINNTDALQKSYINECLLRSLGLPEISKGPDGILSVRKADSKIDFTQNDYDILKWLYSPTIKAGDDKYEVIKQLNEMR